jgi:uncharacterized protein
MKLSKFVVICDTTNANSRIAFSTLTRAIVQLPTWLYKSLQNRENIIENCKDLEMLKRTGIVVDDDIDEDHVYKFWSNRVRYDNSKLAITLIMTYACNCKCKYCYEEGIRQGPDGAYMTLDMCEKISNWVKKYMILREPRLLDVCFHGGEPLLKIDEILFLANNLKKFCEDRGVKYIFSTCLAG